MTSLLREEVSVPIALGLFQHDHFAPGLRQPRATARPITPAPTTTQSTSSMCIQVREISAPVGLGSVVYRRFVNGCPDNPLDCLEICRRRVPLVKH